jgi:hypothetical protein
MARMIPAQIYSDNPSLGEKEIFRRLANDPNTENWIVLHSLDIASHVKRLAGEVDFVIIVPNKGVLCLEVKATSKIRRDNGLWFYGNSPTPDVRGPFKQSSQGMHSIRTYLLKQDSSLSNIPFWSAVIFPYLQFNITSDEWHYWQVIDNTGFRRNSISKLVLKVLNNARDFLKKSNVTWFYSEKLEPTQEQCKQIANVLRPDFEVYESPYQALERLDKDIIRYTAEQFTALDSMVSNKRIIFSGPAGTGKTVLAIEAARRSRALGNRVLFLCFNRLLGQHLEQETKTLSPEVTTCTLHKHMLTITQADVPKHASNDFWQNQLPEKAINKLLEDSSKAHIFDEVIIDEMQDILHPNYLDFIDLSLKGGLNSGYWKFFGDFERQAIYLSNAELSIEEVYKTQFVHAVRYNLRINCRNTPRIANLVQALSGFTEDYSKILRPDNKVEPEIVYYQDDDEQVKHLLNIIQNLKNNGFKNDDIRVLSTKSVSNAITSKVASSSSVKFASYDHPSKKSIICHSIHAFKGLESSVVIVTDVEEIAEDMPASLLYIAMTRALHRLYILAHTDLRNDVVNMVLNRGNK